VNRYSTHATPGGVQMFARGHRVNEIRTRAPALARVPTWQ